MDARQMSCTKAEERNASRIYLDLTGFRSLPTSFSNVKSKNLIMDREMPKLRVQRPANASKVCIVGAGAAGLRCADILIQHGFKVTILEARDRIGGRIHQTVLPTGATVDMGPNWVHGTENNTIHDLAKATKTSVHAWSDHSAIFSEDGVLVKDASALTNILWEIIKKAFKFSQTNCSIISENKSLHEYFAEEISGFIKETDGDYLRKRILVMQMAELWGGYVGMSVQQQSLKFFWLEECINGENLFCSSTFKNILARIAEPALETATVKLSTKVTHIISSGLAVRVKTDNGLDLEFDEIVVTCPLGYLQKNLDMFSPSLPTRLSEAITSVGYGSLEKVFITFPRAFWLADGVVCECQNLPGFTQWLSPAYANATNPDRWYHESVDLASIPGEEGHPTLLFYIHGDQSLQLTTDLAKLTELQKTEYLIAAFKPYYSLLPCYAEDNANCKPVCFLATNWLADEFAGNGSYSNFPIGVETASEDIEIMREGLPGRGVWFAGEHTGPFIALGTVTSAYWSGEAVGKRIAIAYGTDLVEAVADATGVTEEVTDIPENPEDIAEATETDETIDLNEVNEITNLEEVDDVLSELANIAAKLQEALDVDISTTDGTTEMPMNSRDSRGEALEHDTDNAFEAGTVATNEIAPIVDTIPQTPEARQTNTVARVDLTPILDTTLQTPEALSNSTVTEFNMAPMAGKAPMASKARETKKATLEMDAIIEAYAYLNSFDPPSYSREKNLKK